MYTATKVSRPNKNHPVAPAIEFLNDAKNVVNKAIANAKDHIMILDRFVPWRGLVVGSEAVIANDIRYIIFPVNGECYCWFTIPEECYSMPGRTVDRQNPALVAPKSWRGLRDGELQAATKVSTAAYCFPDGYKGGASTLEGAIEMVKLLMKSSTTAK